MSAASAVGALIGIASIFFEVESQNFILEDRSSQLEVGMMGVAEDVFVLGSSSDVQCSRAVLKRSDHFSAVCDGPKVCPNHWDGLILFANDGRIEMDTNTVERSIRPLALNRKNALFAGHDRGADHWATVASLIETCKLNGVDPQAYLASVLSRLVNGWPMRRIDELMPWAYAVRQNATDAA